MINTNSLKLSGIRCCLAPSTIGPQSLCKAVAVKIMNISTKASEILEVGFSHSSTSKITAICCWQLNVLDASQGVHGLNPKSKKLAVCTGPLARFSHECYSMRRILWPDHMSALGVRILFLHVREFLC